MKRRTNITINESIYAKAQELMAADDFSDFSGFVEQLIRDEWSRRHPVRPVRPIGDSFAEIQAEVAATVSGAHLNEGVCLTGEQAAAATIQQAAAAALGKPVSYRPAKGKRAKSAQSPQS
jgi:hypothetical protein